MVTKRQLGIFLVVLSVVGMVGIVAVDILGADQWGGFGPLQRLGILLGLTGAVVGLLLTRLGDRPA